MLWLKHDIYIIQNSSGWHHMSSMETAHTYIFFLLSLKPSLSSIERNDFPLWNPSASTGIAGSSKLRKFQFPMASFRAQSPHLIYYPWHSYFLFFFWMIVGETGSARGNSPSSHSIPGPFFCFFWCDHEPQWFLRFHQQPSAVASLLRRYYIYKVNHSHCLRGHRR